MTKPVRVQLSRAKGWRMPLNTVKVDRSTKWGNPFSGASAIECGFASATTAGPFVVDCFRAWLGGGPRADAMWMGQDSEAARQRFNDLTPLRGKNLACWCKPGAPCHADVLLEVANQPREVTDPPSRAPVTWLQVGVECPLCSLTITTGDDWRLNADGSWSPRDQADQFLRCDDDICEGFVEMPRVRLVCEYDQ